MSAYAFALMAARMGLDRPAVVAAAMAIVDQEGVEALSMAPLAGELGIRGPSLYAHVRNQAELRRGGWGLGGGGPGGNPPPAGGGPPGPAGPPPVAAPRGGD